MGNEFSIWRGIHDRFSWFRAFTATVIGTAFMWVGLHIAQPGSLFSTPYSTVVLDKFGLLVGASIAADGQWRFPPDVQVPQKFACALIRYEDQRFWFHHGVDPIGLARAFWTNLREHEVISGGSTLTMQLMRLARDNPYRTIPEKILEGMLALNSELFIDKNKILELYAAHAPFGGNVVGLEAASWRYFGRSPDQLSWSESATLAILPNSPALVRPGKNHEILRQKRDRLLGELFRDGTLDQIDYNLAIAEPIPETPHDLPRDAPHYVERIRLEQPNSAIRARTNLDLGLQRAVNEILRHRQAVMAGNGIRSAAVLVLDVGTGAVLAYAGNFPDIGITGRTSDKSDATFTQAKFGGDWNDMVLAKRSTGSILKPFLYAAQLEAGELLPNELVTDVPTRFSGFVPENNSRSYLGAIPADQALARSLNIPAVRNLRSFGLNRFYDLLKQLGISTLFRSADQYGLPLIIGGAEGTLWDLTHMYADLARCLSSAGYGDGDSAIGVGWGDWPLTGKIYPNSISGSGYRKPDGTAYPYSTASVWLTLKALTELLRPEEEGAWEDFLSSHRVAWKTGTSYGFRDAWAIGITGRYAVGVWTGNASGEGRPELRGYTIAAPILFDVIGGLPRSDWFRQPSDLKEVEVCADSGCLAGPDCQNRVKILVPPRGAASRPCPYCRIVHVDQTGSWQVTAGQVPAGTIKNLRWFVLPPHIEWYYRRWNASYKPLPLWMPGSSPANSSMGSSSVSEADLPFSLFFPEAGTRIYVPIDIDGKPGMTVFQAAHRDPRAVLYWHLDGDYLGSTREIHQIEARPGPGRHVLTLVDANGLRLERSFIILSKQ